MRFVRWNGVRFRKAPKQMRELIDIVPSKCSFCGSKNLILHLYWEEHKDYRVNDRYKCLSWDHPGGWDLYCDDYI